jgi:hypothetical protein
MNKDAVKAAVDLLVATDRYAELKKELRGLIKTQDKLPRQFAGELEVLNGLIKLHGRSEEAFENVINLIEVRRVTDGGKAKPEYMRDYMRQRRARENTALMIEEMERGAPLGTDARVTFKKTQMAKWMAARDAYIASHGKLTWEERNIVTGDFWEKMDTQLENQLAQARMGAHKKRK